MADTDDRYQRISLRIPRELHEKLMLVADARSRSMNAEIITRLEASFGKPVVTRAVEKTLREEITKQIDLTQRLRLKATVLALQASSAIGYIYSKIERIKDSSLREFIEKNQEELTNAISDFAIEVRREPDGLSKIIENFYIDLPDEPE